MIIAIFTKKQPIPICKSVKMASLQGNYSTCEKFLAKFLKMAKMDTSDFPTKPFI